MKKPTRSPKSSGPQKTVETTDAGEQLLRQLYGAHDGKVSDKWSIYLDEYDRMFSKYRNQPVRILEIGIQNGGSLEIWGKYFPRAEVIIGCDINEACGLLNFDDKRISVVVGDANADETQRHILEKSGAFEIVIDDGSHKSSDVVQTFSRYFPHLADGGVFVVEDLHTSYWQDFEGGLYDPLSSMSFFKRLLDLVNHEHWGLEHSRTDALMAFASRYGIAFDETTLASIHSIEFLNSLCVITKRPPLENVLGPRFVAGRSAVVVPDILTVDGVSAPVANEARNPWSLQLVTIEREIAENRKAVSQHSAQLRELADQIAHAQENIRDSEAEAARAKADAAGVAEELQALETQHSAAHASYSLLLSDRDHARSEEKRLRDVLDAVYASSSWRLTRPLRGLRRGAAALASASSILKKRKSSDATESPAMARGISDGTNWVGMSAPSFEALSANLDEGTSRLAEIEADNSKLIAFYLPQFHRIPENSEWWGPGFTEWTNVSRAKPNFDGHVQPNIPRELGYYDLENINVIREQAELAKLYGIGGFCFYHYWFSGRRILENPVQNLLESDVDIKFCLCWANENWTRTWDGDTKSVLLAQEYAEGDAQAFFDSIADALSDERYIRISGKPLLLVYRAKAIPNPSEWFEIWRKRAEQQGFPGLYIAVVDFYDISNPNEVGADALVEFPPHKFNGPQSRPDVLPRITNSDFAGGIVDYQKVVSQSALREVPSFKLFRGIMPSWDNTPRRQNTPTIVVNSSPYLYGAWLRYLRAYVRTESPDEAGRLIFINAWNEWGEGCYLEPDQKHGLSYLEETLKTSFRIKGAEGESEIDGARSLLFKALKQASAGGESPFGLDPEAELASYHAPSAFAQKTAFELRKWPKIHKVAKFAYIVSMRLGRRNVH
ncbi:glycoside hydrolase family 99-like domain-containing protein [Mesorhizobium sp. ArgA1]